jgi:hypothetical protein
MWEVFAIEGAITVCGYQLHYDVECPSIEGYASPYLHFCQSTRRCDSVRDGKKELYESDFILNVLPSMQPVANLAVFSSANPNVEPR